MDFSIDPNRIDEALWVTNAIHHVRRGGDVFLPMLASVAIRATDRHPDDVGLADALGQVRDHCLSELGGARSLEVAPHSMLLGLLRKGVDTVSVAGPYRDDIIAVSRDILRDTDNSLQAFGSNPAVGSIPGRRAQMPDAQQFARRVFVEARRAASANSRVEATMDALFRGALGVGIAATAAEILNPSTNPSFVNAVASFEGAFGSGGFSLRSGDVQTSLGQLLGTLEPLMSANLAELRPLVARAGSLVDAVNLGQDVIPGAPTATQVTQLEAVEAGVEALGLLVGFASPRAGRVVATVGRAAIKVAQTINQVTSAFRAATTVVGSMLAVTNVVGAVAGIAALFGGGSSATEGRVLNELRDLKDTVERIEEKIDALGAELSDRFDQVDRRLSEIMAGVRGGFADITRHLRGIAVDINNVSREIVVVEDRLGGLEQRLSQRFEDALWVELYTQISASLTHPSPQTRAFEAYWQDLHSFYAGATLKATRGEWVERRRDTADEAILAVLSRPDLSGAGIATGHALGFLTNVAAQELGAVLGADDHIANPLAWSVNAEAYIQTFLLYTQHEQTLRVASASRNVAADQIQGMIDTGRAIQTMVGAVQRGFLPVEEGRPALYQALVTRYRSSGRDVAQAVVAVLERYQGDAGLQIDPFDADPYSYWVAQKLEGHDREFRPQNTASRVAREQELWELIIGHRVAFAARLRIDTENSSPLRAALTALDSSKALIVAFLSLAFPHRLQVDDALRGLLFGTEALLDSFLFRADLVRDARGAHSGLERFPVLTNMLRFRPVHAGHTPPEVWRGPIDERLAALELLVARLDYSNEPPPFDPIVASTLARLEALLEITTT